MLEARDSAANHYGRNQHVLFHRTCHSLDEMAGNLPYRLLMKMGGPIYWARIDPIRRTCPQYPGAWYLFQGFFWIRDHQVDPALRKRDDRSLTVPTLVTIHVALVTPQSLDSFGNRW